MASTFMSCGFVIFYGVLDVPKVLLWVPAVLMNKLIMGFSIRREEYIKWFIIEIIWYFLVYIIIQYIYMVVYNVNIYIERILDLLVENN